MLPRTRTFSGLTATVPSDDSLLVPGSFTTSDAGTSTIGQLKEYQRGDIGVELVTTASVESWWLYNLAPPTATELDITANVYYARVKQGTSAVSCGICGRVGGTFSTSVSGGVERWWGADGYAIILEIDPITAQCTVSVTRYNGGSGSVLTTVTSVQLSDSQTIALRATIVDDVNNDPVITVYLDRNIVATVTDTDGAAITSSGRYGFLSSYNTSGASATDQTRTGIRGFTVLNGSTNETILTDDFKRPNATATDSVRSRQIWHSTDLLTVSNGSVTFSGTTNTDYLALYQVPLRSTRYTVSVDVNFGIGVGPGDIIGLAVRSTKTSAGSSLSDFSGYLCTAEPQQGSNRGLLRVDKYVNGRLHETLPGEGNPGFDTVFTQQTLTVDITEAANGSVRIVVDYAGNMLERVDNNNDAHKSAGQVGLFARRGTVSSFDIDTFVVDDPIEGTTIFPSVALNGEEVDVEPSASPTYIAGELIAPGGTSALVIPYAAVSSNDVAIWDSATRLTTITAGTPTTSEANVSVSGSITTVTLGYTPSLGELFRYEIRTDVTSAMRLNTTLTGTQNGINTTFALTQTPVANNRVRLVSDGFEMTYTTDNPLPSASHFRHVSGNTYELGYAPAAGEVLRADIEITGGSSNDLIFREIPTKLTATQFQLAAVPRSGQLGITASGVRLTSDEFSVGGTVVTVPGQYDTDEPPVVDYIASDFTELLLSIPATIDYAERSSFPNRTVRFDSGYTQRSPLTLYNRRRFACRWEFVDQGTRDILANFLRARFGSYEQFEWVPPTETTPVLVHLASVDFNDTLQDTGVYSVTAELEELFR